MTNPPGGRASFAPLASVRNLFTKRTTKHTVLVKADNNFENDRILEVESILDEKNKKKVKQYRMTSRTITSKHGETFIDAIRRRLHTISKSIERITKKYIQWTFSTTFTYLLSVTALLFLTFTLFFALIIMINIRFTPLCLSSGEIEDWSNRYKDSWTLAWTTFSTVGYGLISVSTVTSSGYENDLGKFLDDEQCIGLNILCALTCLFGQLYIAFVAASVFARLLRFQSHATVKFSENIVLRVDDEESNENVPATGAQSESSAGQTEDHEGTFACPVLTFRIVNTQFHSRAGEIIDAKVKIVALVDSDQLDKKDRMFAGHTMYSRAFGQVKEGMNKWGYTQTKTGKKSIEDAESMSIRTESVRSKDSSLSADSALSQKPSAQNFIGKKNGSSVTQVMMGEQDHAKMLFTAITVKPSEHPYFKRVWRVSHTLDHNSPLLTKQARKEVKKHKGRWPESLCGKDNLNESVNFDQLLVSFSGTSNATGENVTTTIDYSREDILIGHRFESMLVRNMDGSVGVKLDALNDTKESPFSLNKSNIFSERSLFSFSGEPQSNSDFFG